MSTDKDYQVTSDSSKVRANWDRYRYAKDRGHDTYVQDARKNEDMYLGGGLQWDADVKSQLNKEGRPTIEKNLIWPAINTAEGLQIQSRVQVAFRPRKSGANEETAEVLGKLVRQINDDIMYHWFESQVYSDGLIQQRGYLEFRMDFDSNLTGDISLNTIDPLDVMPDPDANSYDPKDWKDIVVVKWLTVDEIAQLYGQEKADKVDSYVNAAVSDPEDDYRYRSRFGDEEGLHHYTEEAGIKRVLVIDRQCKRLERQDVLVYPYGDIVPAASLGEEKLQRAIEEDGAFLTKRMAERIRWTVSTADVLLHDDWSPYRTYTIIPFFPYFRRGRTRGMIDNLRSPQDLHNKLESQILHIISTTANSGWLVPQNSLVNMAPDDLQNVGAKTGLVVEYDPQIGPPQKMSPNPLPVGLDRLVERSEYASKQISGISDAVRGQDAVEVSGVAKQAAQYAGQTQLARPIDNLAKTRHFAARKVLELIQDFYTDERVFMIAGPEFPKQQYDELVINEVGIDGNVYNDLTIGEYDVVITDQPSSATFLDNQYQQALELRVNAGVNIPDEILVKYSSMTDKYEVMEAMSNNAPPPDPEKEAKAEEIRAKAALNMANVKKVESETVDTAIKSQYSAVQGAAAIVQMPGIAPVADTLLRSAGYEDKDESPIVPSPTGLAPQQDLSGINVPPLPEAPEQAGAPTVPTAQQPPSPEVGGEAGSKTARITDNI